MFTATTTITLLGGIGVDGYGDPVDTDEVKLEGVSASILEQAMTSRSRPVDGRTDQVRSYTLRVGPTVDLLKYQRVRDERTGDVYTLDTVTRPVNPVGHRTFSAVLRRIT